MSRRRKQSNGEILIELIGYTILAFGLIFITGVKLIIAILTFVFSMIGFYKTKYKEKSGNGFFKTRFNKGNWGEYKLYKKLINIFGEHRLLTNIYLPSTNIDNTEIDVLGTYNGIIYCFEVKNYGGYIYGNKNDNYWTQVLNFRTKHKFYNPFKQNYAHQKALEEYLGIEAKEIIPILVFSNRANLENVNTDGDEIFMLNDNFVFDFETTFRGTLSDEEIINKLSERTNANEFIKNEHIKQIEEIRKY